MADAIKGFHLDDGSLVHYDYRYLDNVVTDSALNQTGVAADGKAVGDAIASVTSGLNLNTITFEASAMTCSTGTIDENTSFVTLVYNDYLVYVHYYLRITDPNGRPTITISGVPSDIIAFQISGYPTHQRVGSTNAITDGSQITHLENANTMVIQCFNFIGSFPEGSGWLTLSGSGMRSTTDVETVTGTISDAISDIQSNIEDLSTTRLRYLGTIPETGTTTAAVSSTEGSIADIIEEVWEEFPNDGIPFSAKIAANGGALVVIGVRYSSVYGSVMWSHYLVGSGSVHVNNGTFTEVRNVANKLVIDTVVGNLPTINAGGTASISVSCAKSGYTPIGVVGWANGGHTGFYPYELWVGSSTSIAVYVRNITSSAISNATLSVRVLYMKN